MGVHQDEADFKLLGLPSVQQTGCKAFHLGLDFLGAESCQGAWWWVSPAARVLNHCPSRGSMSWWPRLRTVFPGACPLPSPPCRALHLLEQPPRLCTSLLLYPLLRSGLARETCFFSNAWLINGITADSLSLTQWVCVSSAVRLSFLPDDALTCRKSHSPMPLTCDILEPDGETHL